MNAIITFSGSFSPIHKGHVEMISKAKDTLINKGYNVIKAIICPSTDNYVKYKLGKDAILFHHRMDMCKLALYDYDWIEIKNFNDPSSRRIAQKVYNEYKNKYSDLIVFELGGSDYAMKCNPDNFSSKYFRPFICFARNNDQISKHIKNPSKYFIIVDNVADVSSTQLREHYKNNTLDKCDNIDKNVAEYWNMLK